MDSKTGSEEASVSPAQRAEDEHKSHARDCGQCLGIGTANPGTPGRERCDRGKELYTSWNSYRPARLTGDRRAPDGREFAWGVIVKTHHIGPDYQIVEYRQDQSRSTSASMWATHCDIVFHPYLDRKDMSASYDTLEEAIVGAIAHKYGGPNSGAGYYASKILGLYDQP